MPNSSCVDARTTSLQSKTSVAGYATHQRLPAGVCFQSDRAYRMKKSLFNGAYDNEALHVLECAYELACTALSISDATGVQREILAKSIMSVAETGERDSQVIAETAAKMLQTEVGCSTVPANSVKRVQTD